MIMLFVCEKRSQLFDKNQSLKEQAKIIIQYLYMLKP
jgi:hypothetical protein